MVKYDEDLGRHIAVDDVTLHASGQETATGTSDPLAMGDRSVLRLTLDVTAVGGDADETMDVTVETSQDGATGWTEVAAFTQATQPGGATTERKVVTGCDRHVRAVWTMAGTTPDFTFALTGEAL